MFPVNLHPKSIEKNHFGKLLGQKLVDESNYFVPMPWNITCEKNLHFAMVFKG
jgi:hypothetical protein